VGRRFWRVWSGEAVSGIGDAAFAVAFAWLVLSTTGSAGVLAGVLVAGALTRGGLLLLGGAVVDRVSARTALLTAHLVRGVAVGGLAIAAAGTPPVVAFAAAAVVVGAADAFAAPAGGLWLLASPATRSLGAAPAAARSPEVSPPRR
jgi:hypothetical protein